MVEYFNKLSPAELERLSLLSEELGEVQLAIGKILRHGYESYHPFNPEHDGNREDLNKEIGHVFAAVDMMIGAGDLDENAIYTYNQNKLVDVIPYLHHQG